MHSPFASAGLLIACLSAPGFVVGETCAGPPALEAKVHAHPDATAYSEIGVWFGDHQKYGCAIEAFRAALKLEPNSGRLNYLIGLSLYSSGHADEAVAALQESLRLAPDSVKPHLILGAALAQLHRGSEAKAAWETALKFDPQSAEALDFLSKMLIAEGDYDGTIALLRSAALNEELALRLSFAYDKTGAPEKAAQVLKTALQSKPSSLPLASALEATLVKQSLFQEAIKVAAKAAELHPDNLDAERVYFRLLVVNNDYALAAPLGRKLLLRAPHDAEVLYLNGVVERVAGQFPVARRHLEEAVRLNPKDGRARLNYGVVLLELKDAAGARVQLEKAIELGVTEPDVHFRLAAALRVLGETGRAQEQLDLYQQQLAAQSNRALAASKAAQGDQELAAGDLQKALALYRESVAAVPNDPVTTFKLALALDRTGNVDEETRLLQHAVEENPGFALAQNQLGYLASQSGDSATAEQRFRQAVQAAPEYVQAWVSLAATLGMESRFAEAQQALTSALALDPKNEQALQLRKALEAAQSQH